MPTKEYQPQEIEPDITIEPETAEAYTPDEADNITAENSHETIDTPDTHTSQDTIYNTTIENGEENVEPSGTISQTYLTTTPADETSPYTETDQTPPDISQYPTFTTPGTQKALITEQLYPHAATVGGTSTGKSLNEIYRTSMDDCKIDTEYLDKTEVTLLDTINYIIKLEEDSTKIYALKLAEEMYKDGIITEPDKETIKTLDTYLDILKEAELLEAEGFKNVYNNITTDTIKKSGLFNAEELEKGYNNDTLEVNDQTYTLNPEKHNILKSAYKEALKSGIDDIPTSQANELFIDCLENKKDEIKRNTQIAYI